MRFVAAICTGAFVALVARERIIAHRRTRHDSDRRRTPTAMSSVMLGLASACVGFVVLLAITGTVGIALPLSVGCAAVPRLIVVRRISAARRRTLEAWPDALRSIRSSLLAGRSLHTALADLVTSGPLALRPIFTRYARLASTLDQAAALEVIRDEAGDPYVDRIVEVLIAATDAGPATVLDIIDDLAEAAMDDLQLRMRVETAGLEQRINAGLIMAVPVVMLLLLNSVSPIYRTFYASGAGLAVVSAGMALSMIGMLAVRKLAVLPGEPRVFVRQEVRS